jgi:hypothetical protein
MLSIVARSNFSRVFSALAHWAVFPGSGAWQSGRRSAAADKLTVRSIGPGSRAMRDYQTANVARSNRKDNEVCEGRRKKQDLSVAENYSAQGHIV